MSTGTRKTQPLSPLLQKGASTVTLLAGKEPLGLQFSLAPGQSYRLGSGAVDIPLSEDDEVSPVHAAFEYRGSSLVVVDKGSANGVYVRIREPKAVGNGDWIRVGSQYFRVDEVKSDERFATADGTLFFTSPKSRGSFRLLQILRDGLAGLSSMSSNDEITVGGEGATIGLSADPFLSATHARVVRAPDGQCFLHDLGSTNGTWLRIRGEAPLTDGDEVMVGTELLRVSMPR